MPLVVGGLFVNHLFAKAGLFWLAGVVGGTTSTRWPAIAAARCCSSLLALFVVAIAGLPPFPGLLGEVGAGHAVDPRPASGTLDRR